MSTIAHLTELGIAKPPRWLPTNTHYETIMGSEAYGVSSGSSDVDIYGFAIPHKNEVFPHLRGDIPGFGRQKQRFDQYHEHHLADPSGQKSYDVTVYGIVRYFQLAMENNPNILDSLFTPATCVLHVTRVGNMVRDNRKLFLHKGCWYRFKGYAYSQLHQTSFKNPQNSKRKELIDAHGYDTKFAYHGVRLLLEAEQILATKDLNLQRDREQLKSIRLGEWTEKEIKKWASAKTTSLEKLYAESDLPQGPDEPAIKSLLLNCLEEHFGDLSSCVLDPDAAVLSLRAIAGELDKIKHLI